MARPKIYNEVLVARPVKITVDMINEIERRNLNFSDWVRKAWHQLETSDSERELIEIREQMISLRAREGKVLQNLEKKKEIQEKKIVEEQELNKTRELLSNLEKELKDYQDQDRILCNTVYPKGITTGVDAKSRLKMLEAWLTKIREAFKKKYSRISPKAASLV